MSSTKKPEKLKDDSVFSKNNNHRIKYRKRVQEDKEKEQEVREFVDAALRELPPTHTP